MQLTDVGVANSDAGVVRFVRTNGDGVDLDCPNDVESRSFQTSRQAAAAGEQVDRDGRTGWWIVGRTQGTVGGDLGNGQGRMRVGKLGNCRALVGRRASGTPGCERRQMQAGMPQGPLGVVVGWLDMG